MASDVRATHLTSSGSVFLGRTRVKAIHYKGGTTPTLVLKNGDANGTTLLTMNFVDNDISNAGFIDWLITSYDNINLSQFYSIDNTMIGSNYLIDNSKIHHLVNSYYYDKNDHTYRIIS